ncbi:MAG: hypothetical protein ACYTF1_24690 [Planctomycetota bacterium]
MHSSSATTKIYTHPNFDLAADYVNRLPELLGRLTSQNVTKYTISGLIWLHKTTLAQTQKTLFSRRKRGSIESSGGRIVSLRSTVSAPCGRSGSNQQPQIIDPHKSKIAPKGAISLL